MKRWLCLVLALTLICPCLLVGASAAETYVFEPMPSVSTYAGFEFTNYDDSLVYEGYVPPGLYDVYVVWEHRGVDGSNVIDEVFSLTPVNIVYSFSDSFGYPACEFDVSFDVSNSIFTFTFLLFDCSSEGASLLGLLVDGEFVSGPDYVELIPVNDTIHLSEFVTDDIVDSVFLEILAVLPVVVCGVVLILSTRKGIAFLQSFLHDS